MICIWSGTARTQHLPPGDHGFMEIEAVRHHFVMRLFFSGVRRRREDSMLEDVADERPNTGAGLPIRRNLSATVPTQGDNRVLAGRGGSLHGSSAAAGLTSMSPWRGRPIIEPSQFASLVDASRRARRR